MRIFAELRDGVVVALGESPMDPEWNPGLPEWQWVPPGLGVGPGWVHQGGRWTAPQPPAWSQADYVHAVQEHLDAWARTRNYDGILSLCTYATSTVERFKAEGQCGVEARDRAWAAAYAYLSDVQAGRRPLILPTDLVAELPEMVWP